MTKEYDVAIVLSVSTGRRLCELNEYLGLMSHIVGYKVMLHQIPALTNECRTSLLEQHPGLQEAERRLDQLDAELESDSDKKIACAQWVERMIAEGVVAPQLHVASIPDEYRTEHSPFWGLPDGKKVSAIIVPEDL